MKGEPIRVIEGTTRPHEAFWKWRDALEPEGGPELEFYGFISEYSWFDDDITPKMFKDQLLANGKGGPVTVRMNSGGGEMIAASVIRAMMVDYPGKITVKIDGLAASAATIVAMAGDKIMMQESAYMMIHDPSCTFFLASLNIEDMGRYLDELKTLKGGILDVYESKTKMSRDKLSKMMSNETWMTARDALGFGFIDEIILPSAKKEKASPAPGAVAFVNALKNYRNVPAMLLQAAWPVVDPADQLEHQQAADRLRAEVKILKRGE